MPRILLVCHIGPEVGIGHLSRLLALASTLKKNNYIIPEFLIFGDILKKKELDSFTVYNFTLNDNFTEIIKDIAEKKNYSACIFDLYPSYCSSNLYEMFSRLKQHNIRLVTIDSLIDYEDILDLIWIPSFYFDARQHRTSSNKFQFGWNNYLIQKRCRTGGWQPGSRILILTGGSDISELGKTLPNQIDESLNKNVEINWVRGPFSCQPTLPKKPRLNWNIHYAPDYLDELIVQSDYVMTVYGVSFFEVLQYGIPTVVFSFVSAKYKLELEALSEQNVAMVAYSPTDGIEGLIKLMKNDELAGNYSLNALNKMSNNGAQNLSNAIYSLIGIE
jgi:spore coat polysaccharide biosynthesis predicted glycosyltransferase SpsG